VVKVIWHKTASPPQTNCSIVFARWRQRPSHVGTLAPPGEYRWTCASFGPSQSTVQTGNRSVQPFLHSSRHKVTILTMGCSFPKNASSHGGSRPHVIHGSLGPPASSTPTASRSAQPFLQGSLVWQTDIQTDRPRYSVGNNRPHQRTVVRSTGDAV